MRACVCRSENKLSRRLSFGTFLPMFEPQYIDLELRHKSIDLCLLASHATMVDIIGIRGGLNKNGLYRLIYLNIYSFGSVAIERKQEI